MRNGNDKKNKYALLEKNVQKVALALIRVYYKEQKVKSYIKADTVNLTMESTTWEIISDMKQSMKKPSVLDKLKEHIFLKKLRESELKQMVDEFIKEVKPIYAESCRDMSPDKLRRLLIESFEPGIKQISKSDFYQLYKSWKAVKEAKTKEGRNSRLTKFLIRLALLNSVNGYFNKKAFE